MVFWGAYDVWFFYAFIKGFPIYRCFGIWNNGFYGYAYIARENSSKKRWIIGIICFFVLGITRSFRTTEKKDVIPAKDKKVEIKVNKEPSKPLYDPAVLDIMPTELGKGYDKSIKKYGVEGIKKLILYYPKQPK